MSLSFARAMFPHGRVRVKKSKRYLLYEDGTPFFWLADTWWFAMTSRAKWPEPFQSIVNQRKKQGFTVSQIVVGYPPEVSLDSENAANSGGFPFLQNGQINPAYFEEVDKKIGYLLQAGIVPMIVGSWGHHIDVLGTIKIKALWQEIIKRYQHYPVIFCLTGEADIFPDENYGKKTTPNAIIAIIRTIIPPVISMFFKQHFPQQIIPVTINSLEERVKKWDEVARFIKKTLTKPVPLTVHVTPTTSAGELFHFPDWLDIDSFQSGHDYQSRSYIFEKLQSAALPRINLEPWYEQIKGEFGAEDQRYMFWVGLLSGASGISYGAHGVWNMSSTKDEFLDHWGKSDWRTALYFPGAENITVAKEWIQQFQWNKLKPSIKIVSPQISKKKPLNPVAARCKNDYFIYVPSGKTTPSIHVHLLQTNKNMTALWINLKTFQSELAFSIYQSSSWKFNLLTKQDTLLWLHFGK